MNELHLLWNGAITLSSQPMALFLAVFGVALGIVIGALPGLTATMGVALLLPMTFGMDATQGILMLLGAPPRRKIKHIVIAYCRRGRLHQQRAAVRSRCITLDRPHFLRSQAPKTFRMFTITTVSPQRRERVRRAARLRS